MDKTKIKYILKKIPAIKMIYMALINKLIRGRKKKFIHKTAKIYDKNKQLILKKNAQIWEYVVIRVNNKIIIGENTQIGPFCVIYSGNNVYIGKNVMIAPHCMIASGNHNYKQTEKPMRFANNLTKGPIIIEDDVWIGANCTITDGVKICKGAVIGANSVINKDVAPYNIVAGVPAKVIGNRKNKNKKQ